MWQKELFNNVRAQSKLFLFCVEDLIMSQKTDLSLSLLCYVLICFSLTQFTSSVTYGVAVFTALVLAAFCSLAVWCSF